MLKSLASEERTVVFYESPHRILKTLDNLHEAMQADGTRRVVIARELTKMHEEIIDATVETLPEIAKKLTVKGEFVIVLAGATL